MSEEDTISTHYLDAKGEAYCTGRFDRRMGFARNRVTVVITTYNAGRYLRRSIDSALGQTYPHIEVIVVDDGSTDDTSDRVKAYKDGIRYIRLLDNRGPAVGRTTGLMTASGEFVTFLDADDYWMPTFVEETVSYLKAHPDVVALNTGYCKRDWDGKDYYRPVLDDEDRDYYGVSGAICPDFYQFWSRYQAILTGTVMMRTETAVKTGGQRADLRLTQDLEFWGYLATFGKWAFTPKPLFVTDQRVLTPKERLAKLKRRFVFFRSMTVDDWARRIRPRLDNCDSKEGFEQFLGHIATTITLANAYSFRFRQSYRIAAEWRDKLDNGLGSVLKYGLHGGRVFWPLVCVALRMREVLKAYSRYPLKRLANEVRRDV